MDMTPLVMGALISKTLNKLVEKGVLSKEDAAEVFLQAGKDIRAAAMPGAGKQQWDGMATLIEMMANKFVKGAHKGPPSN